MEGFSLCDCNIGSCKINTIPKYIFITYKVEYSELPEIIINNIEKIKLLNPKYEIKYYSDTQAEKFINQYFPEYLNDFKTLIPGAYKADLLRLLLLYKYGGIYNDIGHVYLESIDKFISYNDQLIVCKDDGGGWDNTYHLHNAFIASVPCNSFIKTGIDVIISNIRNRFYGKNPLEPTGPGALGKAFNIHFKRKENEYIYVGALNSNIKVFNHPSSEFITNEKGIKIIKTKFDNYYDIIYPEGRPKSYYGNLWEQKNIYHPQV